MKNNLPNWKKFSNQLKVGKKAIDFGFLAKDGDVTRVNARYRVAKSFKKINLETFSDEVILGYSGLVKAFLSYSTLEGYIKLLSNKEKISIPLEAESFIDSSQAKVISEKILKLDNKKKFYAFIQSYVDRQNIKKNIDKFYNGEEHNIVSLLAGVRHIFGHGILSSSSNKIKPKKVNEICNLLSDFILEEIANDFAKRVDNVS